MCAEVCCLLQRYTNTLVVTLVIHVNKDMFYHPSQILLVTLHFCQTLWYRMV